MIPSIIYAAIAFFGEAEAAKCQLEWGSTNLPFYFPLIWNNSEILYPQNIISGKWYIYMDPKTSIWIGCSEVSNLIKKFALPEIMLTCNSRGQLKVGQKTANFTDLGCTNPLKEKVIQSGTCVNGSYNVDILFQSSRNDFPLINLCHNADLDETLMAHHTIHGSALNSFEISNKRPRFKEAQYYNTISADAAYSQKSQLTVVSKLLGSTESGKKYIDPSKSFYFARGHLAPDGDFVHIYEQNATYYFINVVPQWQIINNGNWKALEIAVRKYATSAKVDLEIWTGGKGVLKLPNVAIYLAEDSSGKKLLPAPEILWKVIYDPERNASVVVYVINNPHLTSIPQILISCTDICDQISWITWQTKNIQKGYTYCCDGKSTKVLHNLVPNLGNMILT